MQNIRIIAATGYTVLNSMETEFLILFCYLIVQLYVGWLVLLLCGW